MLAFINTALNILTSSLYYNITVLNNNELQNKA